MGGLLPSHCLMEFVVVSDKLPYIHRLKPVNRNVPTPNRNLIPVEWIEALNLKIFPNKVIKGRDIVGVGRVNAH